MLDLPPDHIPTRWDQMNAAWLTDALQRDFPGVEVSDVELVMHDDGTNRRARYRLSYARGEGPEYVFMKAHAAENRVVHLRNGNLWNEARLFQSGVTLPLDHPKVYKSMVDPLALDFLLVMEDIKQRGGEPRDALRPLSVAQVGNGMRSLARLHSQYWGLDPAKNDKLNWLQTWQVSEGWTKGLRHRVPIGLERAKDMLPAEITRLGGDQIVELWARYVSTLNRGPMTLVHSDAHAANLYTLPGDEVGFLDWQVVRRGAWHLDACYFLVGALRKDDCRHAERDLLETYRAALTVPVAEKPSAEEAWAIYRAAPIYGLTIWISTVGTDGWQPPANSRALIDAYAAAFVELDTLDALNVLAQ